MKQGHPLVSVSVELAFSEQLVKQVVTHTFDMAIARVTDLQDRVALHCGSLRPARHVIAARSGHPLMQHEALRWPELTAQTWIVPSSGNVVRSCLALLLRRKGLPFPAQVVETAALPVVVGLHEQTGMPAPLPESAVEPFRRLGLPDALPISSMTAISVLS